MGQIRTGGFRVLQTRVLGLSTTIAILNWLRWRDSNSQQLVLETRTLPIELHRNKMVQGPRIELGYQLLQSCAGMTTLAHLAILERVARIELASVAWQATRLPLHHTRIILFGALRENRTHYLLVTNQVHRQQCLKGTVVNVNRL